MDNPFSLKDNIFLVTGASSGIGRRISISISEMGGRVLITGRDNNKLFETYKMLSNKTEHMIEVFDLDNLNQIPQWISTVVKNNNIKLDGFVHCAGISILKPLIVLNYKDLDSVMKINLYAGLELLKTIAKPNISNKGSSFLFIASVAGLLGEPGALAYSTSKAAIISAVKTSAMELSKYKHRVNCIAPGMVETPMLQQYRKTLGDEQIDLLEKKFPLGIGDSGDVANAAVFLLAKASKWITGTTLIVDGGYICGK